jgi:DmsE family decaheme c-type cytochrome
MTWSPIGLPLGVLVLVGAAAAQQGPAAAAEEPSAPAGNHEAFDVNDCKMCHEAAVTKMQQTHHGGIAQSCASCHGDVSAHLKSNLEKGEPGPILSFKKLSPAAVNERCLTCHDSGHQANWAGGTHDRRGVACTSCHSVHDFHSTRAQLKTAQDAQTCNTCHTQIRSKTMRVSHHPVREGVMSCSSCHDPHDSTRPKMVSAESVNEKCLSCHTEKRGPFLWEHAPVRENCMLCHDPHGSNHEKLLAAKQPFLCQRCHLNTRHPGTLYDVRNTLTGASLSNRAVEHACKNCHQNVHGSNGPSGPYLGR